MSCISEKNPLFTGKPVDTPSSAPCLSAQWVDDYTTQEPISKHLALSFCRAKIRWQITHILLTQHTSSKSQQRQTPIKTAKNKFTKAAKGVKHGLWKELQRLKEAPLTLVWDETYIWLFNTNLLSLAHSYTVSTSTARLTLSIPPSLKAEY